MGWLSKSDQGARDELEARCRELRRTMQDIVIAHAVICHKHMTAEQVAAAQEEWARMVQGKNWAAFFAGDDTPLPGSHWSGAPAAPANVTRESSRAG